jgi:predicted alpha-1,2-mannosidase
MKFIKMAVAGLLTMHSGLPLVAELPPADEVMPLVGTGGHGHTYPGATAPFGYVQVSPDTRTQGWDACSGYYYSDTSIVGFSHTHISGTGCADLGDLLVMPFTRRADDLPLRPENFKSEFSHAEEHAEPGYYRVRLADCDVLVELTATPHAAMHRYTFPAGAEPHLLVDLVHGLGSKPLESSLKWESPAVVSGWRRSNGWANGKTVYFVLEFSQPVQGVRFELDDQSVPGKPSAIHGKQVRARLEFAQNGKAPLVLRVGLSPTGLEGARNNLKSEMPGWDFDELRNVAHKNWNNQLSCIQIKTSDSNVRQTFYTALYHVLTAPTIYNDADGTYLGSDQKVHPQASFQYYSTMSLWDTFRAEHPLLTLIQPGRVGDFLQTMLAFYEQSPGHALPVWPLANVETGCMIGNHAVPVIVDAWRKGFRGCDSNLLWRAVADSLATPKNFLGDYARTGYVPSEKGRRNYAAARTLEYAYDDWCGAQLAKSLGKDDEVARLEKRAQNYRNVFDAESGFFVGKARNGRFTRPFDPKDITFDDYIEANAWQYAFAVFHDVPGMIALYGGRQTFIAKLDQLFNEDSDMGHPLIDVSGIIGQYAHGNEPCHHVAYLYALAGAQYKTAQRIRQIQLMFYDNTPDGICGNEDCGQMSAWYVWSALGLYPMNPCDGRYLIGSPLVEKAVINLDPKFFKRGNFTLIAHNASKQNGYIQAAKLNGRSLDRPWIRHDELSGGVLELEMGLLPNRKLWNNLPNKN